MRYRIVRGANRTPGVECGPRILDNVRIVRFLSQNHHELLMEFQKIVESRTMLDPVADGT